MSFSHSTEWIEIFFAYSHKDEKKRNSLKKHLRSLQNEGVKIYWQKYHIKRGQEWNGEIPQSLRTAHMICLLISPDFPDADTFWDQKIVNLVMERHRQEEIRVIPIKLRSVDCQGEPYDRLQSLPREGEPVDSRYWKNQDEAFLSIAKDIKLAVNKIKTEIKERQEFQHKRQEYRNEYFKEIQQKPLSEQACKRLNYFRESLDITEKEAAEIEDGVNQWIAAEIAQQKLRVNRRKKIIAGVFAATSLFFTYSFTSSIRMSAEEFYEQGMSYYDQKNWQKAINSYTQAIQREPNNPTYYSSRGNSYYFDGNWQESAKDYTQVIQLDPNNVHAYRYRGESHSNLGNRREAIEDLRKAATLYLEQGKKYEHKAVQARIIQLISQP